MSKLALTHPALSYVENDEHNGSDTIMVDGKMEVCPECQGTGSHVRRDLDDSALVDSMREDGDDEGLERYFAGAFDEVCRVCNGANVVLQPNWELAPKWARDAIEDWNESERQSMAEEAAERRMGA